jgi:hypothetical protein
MECTKALARQAMNSFNTVRISILFFLILLPSGPVRAAQVSGTFRVERVYVFTEYDSSFVLAVANQVLPPDRAVTQADVECLLANLRASGLFDRVEPKWSHVGESVRTLTLRCHAKRGRRQFVISKVSLIDLPEVDKSVFSTNLADKGLKPGTRLLQLTYDQLNDLVDNSIRDAIPPTLVTKYGGSAWISFAPSGVGRIEIKVFPSKPKC